MCPVLTESAPPAPADELTSEVSIAATDDLRLCHSFATYDGQYTPWLAHGNAGAQGRCDRGQRWLGGRPASRLRRQAVFFLPTRYPARKPAVSSRIPPMATPKTPKPLVSSVAAVSGVDDTVASTAAAGAVVAVGAGVLAGDAVGSTVGVSVGSGALVGAIVGSGVSRRGWLQCGCLSCRGLRRWGRRRFWPNQDLRSSSNHRFLPCLHPSAHRKRCRRPLHREHPPYT